MHKCSECVYYTKRKFDLKRHLKNKHKVAKNAVVPINPTNAVRHLGDGLPRNQPRAEPEDGLYTKEEFEETMDTLQARFPTDEFRYYRSEIHASVHGHNCWSIPIRKVNVLYASDKQCPRVSQ